MTDGPLIVQSDKTLLLEVDHERAQDCRKAIAPFAELERSPEHVHTYRLTPLGLWNARAAGHDAEQVVDTLLTYSRYSVPHALLVDIAETMARYGRLRLEKHPVHGLVLASTDRPVLEEVLRAKKVKPMLGARIDDETVAVHPSERGNLKQALLKLGWPAEDFAGYVDGEAHPIELREDGWHLRSYQRDAAESFWHGGSGVVVLPCGAGKTLVGAAAMAHAKATTLILVTNTVSARQWKEELVRRTSLTEDEIGEYSGTKKEIRPVTIATYQVMTTRRKGVYAHLELFDARRAGQPDAHRGGVGRHFHGPPGTLDRRRQLHKLDEAIAGMVEADREILGDPDRVRQMIWNLLSNAIKFTSRGGSVALRIAAIGSVVTLTVTDTGEGIDRAFLPYVFEPFRQADSSTTRSHGGIGLGLAIVRSLVELHGGRITAESEGKGKGATFMLELPVLEGKPAVVTEPVRQRSVLPAASLSLPSLAGTTVLIVDDQEFTRDIIGAIMRRTGATVHVAQSVREGLQEFVRAKPHAVLCDIAMPEEDGYVFLRSVRGRADEARSTPIIALTAFGRPEDRLHALDAGFDAYVKKPVDPAELAETVRRLATS